MAEIPQCIHPNCLVPVARNKLDRQDPDYTKKVKEIGTMCDECRLLARNDQELEQLTNQFLSNSPKIEASSASE